MTTHTQKTQSMVRTTVSRCLVVGGALVLLSFLPQACSTHDILAVNIPNVIDPSQLNSPLGAAAAYAGAIGDFAFANDGDNGGTEGQILVSGVMTDEYIDSETFPTRIEYDSPGIPLTTLQILDSAAQRFDSVLTLGIDTTKADSLTARKIIYLAQVGKARALLDRAQPASVGGWDSAAAVAALVPLSFKYVTTHTAFSNREYNGLHVFNSGASVGGTGRFSVADQEGINGLNFRAATDPRVVTVLQGKGFDGTTDLWALQKYPANNSPVVVADGIEAQLIVAEDQLRNANYSTWLASLNNLRANGGVPGLAPLADPGGSPNDSLRVDLTFRERAFWLFATGHRLGDLRRLIRQYGRGSETVFPTGAYFKGGLYGPDVNLPVPRDERNNPNFTGCLNRAA